MGLDFTSSLTDPRAHSDGFGASFRPNRRRRALWMIFYMLTVTPWSFGLGAGSAVDAKLRTMCRSMTDA